MKTRFYIMLGVASFVLVPGTVRATTVRGMDTAELAKHSVLIVQGTVIDSRVVSDGPGAVGHKNVRTVTTIQVSRTFKGKSEATVEVTVPGGELGNLIYNWPGYPRFKVGEETIVFLYRAPTNTEKDGAILLGTAGTLGVVGLEQGHLSIVEDAGKGKVVKRGVSGLQIEAAAVDTRQAGPRLLSNVATEIENIVAAQGTDAE